VVVFVVWLLYANQGSQRLHCLGFKLAHVPRPLVWTVTCTLNGNP
jgi:hypothetical protein